MPAVRTLTRYQSRRAATKPYTIPQVSMQDDVEEERPLEVQEVPDHAPLGDAQALARALAVVIFVAGGIILLEFA